MYRHQDNKFTERKHTRLQNYDYSTENYYFVTICTHEKKCIFGSPDTLNWCGKFAKMGIENIPLHYEGVKVLQFVIMPNHVHMIIALPSKIFDLSMIIGQYKAFVTKNIRHNDPSAIVWQRSFHDHVIRNQHSYEKIWQYIEGNPGKWEEDCFYTPL
jgi:REP element-mobilizing transposase RayT